MDKTLLDEVMEAMTCPHCDSRVVTHERLARESGLSLRSVVRFLQGSPVSTTTAGKLETWLTAHAVAKVVATEV